MIAIIDYGMGNLHSVSKAVERLGYEVKVTADAAMIHRAQGAILPGVGAFGDAMELIHATRMDETIRQYVRSGKPLLGICLGMQLLFTESEEHGHHVGLQLLPGSVVRFKGDFKVPHMGWNRLQFLRPGALTDELESGHAYFVHSYHVKAENRADLIAVTDYHGEVAAIVGRENIYGMQFHPEKSGEMGMKLLHRFLQMTTAPHLEWVRKD